MAGLPSDYKVDESKYKRSKEKHLSQKSRKGRRKKNKEKEKAAIVSSTTKKLNEIEKLLENMDVKVEDTKRRHSQRLNDFAQV